MPAARYYDESKNESGGSFPGVPLADIDEATWDGLPEWLQRSVDRSPMYRKTPVPKASKPKEDSTPTEAEKES